MKSLNELKLAPRQWFAELLSPMLSLGFNQSNCDYSMLGKRDTHCRAICIMPNGNSFPKDGFWRTVVEILPSSKNCNIQKKIHKRPSMEQHVNSQHTKYHSNSESS